MLTRKKQATDIWICEFIERSQAIQAIRTLREEWEEATQGADLHQAEGNIGMLLDDFARLLGLTPEECVEALGHPLE